VWWVANPASQAAIAGQHATPPPRPVLPTNSSNFLSFPSILKGQSLKSAARIHILAMSKNPGLSLNTSISAKEEPWGVTSTPTTPTAVSIQAPQVQRPKSDDFSHKWAPEKAVWIGNVADDVTEADLKSLFKKVEIQSIAFLRKSRCAFVNLSSQEEVEQAVQLYHDAVVKGGHLVVRARRWPEDKKTASGPPSHIPSPSRSVTPPLTAEDELEIRKLFEPPVYHAYFVQRAVDIESLVQSVFTGTWTVASRCIDQLNAAFVAHNHVWLVYILGSRVWGYARMESEIHHASPRVDNRSIRLDGLTTGYSPFHEALTQSTPFRIRWICSDVGMPMTALDDVRNMYAGGEVVRRSHDGTQLETRAGEVVTARIIAWFKYRGVVEKRFVEPVPRSPQTAFPVEFSRRFGPENVHQVASPLPSRVPQNTPTQVSFPTRLDMDTQLHNLSDYLQKTVLDSRSASPEKDMRVWNRKSF